MMKLFLRFDFGFGLLYSLALLPVLQLAALFPRTSTCPTIIDLHQPLAILLMVDGLASPGLLAWFSLAVRRLGLALLCMTGA